MTPHNAPTGANYQEPARKQRAYSEAMIDLLQQHQDKAIAILASVSLLSFVAAGTMTLGPVGGVLTILGSATCGFSWLFARSLFRKPQDFGAWPWVIVASLMLTGGLVEALSGAGTRETASTTVWGMAAQLHRLLSSTVLLLAFVEPFSNFPRSLPRGERVFRLCFAATYAVLLVISVIWLGAVSHSSWAAQYGVLIKTGCALTALVVGAVSWAYRRANPLPKTKRKLKRMTNLTSEDAALAERIRAVFERDRPHLESDLKVEELAKRLGEQSYKVSQCITGVMGLRNFNHLVNLHRIEAAKLALRDPVRADESILSIALECGFGSIGPFNRAFKDETGTTPRTYRMNALQA